MPILTSRFASRPVLVPCASVLLALASANAVAQEPAEARGTRAQQRHDGQRALADAVRRVERATRGEVLSAERVPFDGRDVSRVKVVDASGRVRVYMDDPQNRRAQNDEPRRTRGNDGNSD